MDIRTLGATHVSKLKPRSWADDGLKSLVEITTLRGRTWPKRWRRGAAGLFPAGWQVLGLLRRECATQAPGVPPVRSGPGRIATLRRTGSGAVKDKASARMPPGLFVRLEASSRPDAGLRLSDSRPNPPHGDNGGQTGRPSPATTRQRTGAHHRSGNRPAEEGPAHHALHTVIDPDFVRDHDLRAIPPCHARMLQIGSRCLGQVGHRPASVMMLKCTKVGVVCAVAN